MTGLTCPVGDASLFQYQRLDEGQGCSRIIGCRWGDSNFPITGPLGIRFEQHIEPANPQECEVQPASKKRSQGDISLDLADRNERLPGAAWDVGKRDVRDTKPWTWPHAHPDTPFDTKLPTRRALNLLSDGVPVVVGIKQEPRHAHRRNQRGNDAHQSDGENSQNFHRRSSREVSVSAKSSKRSITACAPAACNSSTGW